MFEHDVNIVGKHASYMKLLARKNSEDKGGTEQGKSANIFERYIDVYMNAVVWGLLYQKKAKRDLSSEDRARIYADAFATEHDNCVFLYRTVMLLDTSTNLTHKERIDRAFRDDTLPDTTKLDKNMELFHDYVRGGIEFMYEQFTGECFTQDDYLRKIYEVIKAFNAEDFDSEHEDNAGNPSQVDKILKLLDQ